MDKEFIKEILKHEAEAILNIPVEESLQRAMEIIHHHVHELGGKIIMSGMGKAGQIAVNMSTTFCSTGSPSVFLHPAEAQHGDLGIIQPNDVLVLISNSGKTREIVELVALAKRLYEQLPIIVITGNVGSQLADVADVVISTGNPKEVCILGLTPTTSTTVMTVIGDILVVTLMKRIGFTNQEYAKRHHGGYLGNKSREQAEGEEKK
ncbi:MAG: SIS domain-containing protein [Bacteroidales bacterium]|nr:SIS domain-containing protein [Bacteroidales bacterium]MDD5816244.1 SIS domain-containing protein [Bacteroidales bacterium]MDY4520876.1 SIS domain-containing protein [Bacteroidales bacterium]